MIFWADSGVVQFLLVAMLLVAASALRRGVAPLRTMVLPDSMIAGALGMVFGPSVLGLLPLDTDFLEAVVYHSLALVFVAIGLQAPVAGRTSEGARSLAVGIPLLAVLQGIVGLVLVLGWNAWSGSELHPGFGVMLPLAFSQGPGQALSLGTAWEQIGMDAGGQVGLIMAAAGFAWCIGVGVPLTMVAKARGWTTPESELGEGVRPPEGPPREAPSGGMETLTLNLVSVGMVYLATYAVLSTATGFLEGKPGLSAMIWGFHFIVAGILALSYRRVVEWSGVRHRLHDGLLGRIGGTTIDVGTTAAIAAIQFTVLQAYAAPLALFTTMAGLVTLVFSLWIGRRAFPQASFEHALVLFGASTGTMPTALALLRVLDPDLRGPVASSAVLAATAAIVFGAPLLLVVLPIAVSGAPGALVSALGMLVAYVAVLMLGWRYLGPLRYLRPWHHLWPSNDR